MQLGTLALASLLSLTPMLGGDLPATTQAKFCKILASSAGTPGKIACHDSALMEELTKQGFVNDGSCKVAWGASESEVKSLKAAGKLVICGRLEWLPLGGAIALVEEGGKPAIYLHMGNLANSGITMSDTVLKIGKRM